MTEKNHFDGINYADDFKSASGQLPGADIAWLKELRQKSIDDFIKVGIPGPKVEEWKYSNLNALKSGSFKTGLEKSSASDAAGIADIKGSKVVFVDGFYNSVQSEIKNQQGVTLQSLNEFVKSNPEKAQALIDGQAQDNSLRNLNLALMTGGFVLIVDEGVKLAEPIQIIHVVTSPAADKSLRLRNLIHIGKNASAQIIEDYSGAQDVNCWSQNVTTAKLDENATLEMYQFQDQGNETIHMSETLVDVLENANFKHYSLNVGAAMSRTEIKPTLKGENGNVELSGAFLARGGNAHDVFTHMKHMMPQCDSDQNYRGVLDKGGKSAFQGKVYVAKDAQLTNADQSNKNLILDRNAEANSKPELLIYADDVKCSHGATVGELDSEALFYLKSRGLDTLSAKALLVEAFVAEVYQDIEIGAVKEKYLALAREWLAHNE
ncbi:MAG: Fe-S cluster assembly protein SufD [Kordiimonadaceae bacterium]|jgi:Fe-S cluster assembly protein SufD|nr:Fe-S cluster assembly protein SufD [Kordiimonadaceae bacterium]MBT6035561.1 Fe-S cluster assembly protein SufD [Kordiimonadaceae bacterium]MBT6330859.1 Fe-S cluster assembly protein SufD [Kordiimonadaceae bacterium]MBT7581918.1 Fe-S cluster assembly protein SufD [Kordiimonadaceae bacterium]